jgi:hypothetical protein
MQSNFVTPRMLLAQATEPTEFAGTPSITLVSFRYYFSHILVIKGALFGRKRSPSGLVAAYMYRATTYIYCNTGVLGNMTISVGTLALPTTYERISDSTFIIVHCNVSTVSVPCIACT